MIDFGGICGFFFWHVFGLVIEWPPCGCTWWMWTYRGIPPENFQGLHPGWNWYNLRWVWSTWRKMKQELALLTTFLPHDLCVCFWIHFGTFTSWSWPNECLGYQQKTSPKFPLGTFHKRQRNLWKGNRWVQVPQVPAIFWPVLFNKDSLSFFSAESFNHWLVSNICYFHFWGYDPIGRAYIFRWVGSTIMAGQPTPALAYPPEIRPY